MNKALISLTAGLCLSFAGSAGAANGAIAASMTRDAYVAARKNEARLKAAKEACTAAGNASLACKAEVKLKAARI